jgi:hypothetical protein
MDKVLEVGGGFHIKGGGLFFVSQMLAGAFPGKYIIFEENISQALRQLNIVNIKIQSATNDYFYCNQICTDLFKTKLENS